jgi:hypothetical protein
LPTVSFSYIKSYHHQSMDYSFNLETPSILENIQIQM